MRVGEQEAPTSQSALPIYAGIENADDFYALVVNLEGDCYAPLEGDHTKPRPNVVSALAALGSQVEGFTIGGYALDVS